MDSVVAFSYMHVRGLSYCCWLSHSSPFSPFLFPFFYSSPFYFHILFMPIDATQERKTQQLFFWACFILLNIMIPSFTHTTSLLYVSLQACLFAVLLFFVQLRHLWLLFLATFWPCMVLPTRRICLYFLLLVVILIIKVCPWFGNAFGD